MCKIIRLIPLLSAVFLIFLIGTFGCSKEEVPAPVIITVSDENAVIAADKIREELSISIAEGLDVSLWASEELVSDPVALFVDHFGRVWLTITERRRNAELDIRGHRDWMIESVTLENIRERRDFVHRKLATERSEINTWLADHNEDGIHDWRDLTVNKESIFVLEDVTGSGHANEARLFIRDFHDDITDVAGAVMVHNDEVFLGVSPDLWRIKDTTGDGYGDTKESISHGYGVNIGFAGHGISGLTLGPDGRIYWSIGDVGMSVTDQDGKNWHYPRQGVIVRSEPDGSNFEVYAKGFRNTHEFAFDKYGNLIAADNDGDHAGEYERLIYVVNGSDSGWRLNWQFGKYNDPLNNEYKVLMDEGYYRTRFNDQAAHLLPPISSYHSGPAGMAYNPGTALGEEWQNHFFVAEFVGTANRSGINAFTLKESGASFELDRDEQVLQGILATGMHFGPDGALYFADWIDGWTLKQKGRIWKLDSPADYDSPVRAETKNLLAENFSSRSSQDLLHLLEHADMRVRKKAQFELVARGDTESLEQAIHQTDHQIKRIHGIWGLAQIGRKNPGVVEPLIFLLTDRDSEIRAQAAKMLGDVRFEPAGDALIPLLADENARVRFLATEAIGRLSWQPAFQAIVDMLDENNDEDVYLRHGGAIALERLGDEDAISRLAGHLSRAVRIAAVVALHRLESPGVIPFLEDEDEFVVTNAARAINDDNFIEEGLDALAKMLEQERFINEPLIRRAINANLYSGTAADARRLANFALRDDISEPLRAEALQTLAVWPESSQLDRVTGDPRGVVNNNPEDARQAMEPVIAHILNGGSSAVKIAALEAVSSLQFTDVIPGILPLILEDPSPDVRISSLQALIKMEYSNIEEAIYAALEDDEQSVRMNALRSIPQLNLPESSIVALLEPVIENGTINERQTAMSTLGGIDDESAHEVLNRQMDRMIRGELPGEVQLELVLAVEEARSESLQEKLGLYQSEKTRDDSVSVYSESLYGGSAESGRRIFYRDAAAQCIRCHVVDGQGSEVGPDLTSVGNRLSRPELLRSMVDPDGRITPGFGSVTLVLHNGETVRGLLSEETDTHITVTTGDQQRVIEKTDIENRVNSPSGMFNMGDVLTRSELRDLVEFLTTLQGSGE